VDITTVMGIPAHPLMVHVPVVLVPLCAIAAILMIWPSWRPRIGWIAVVLSGVSLVFVQLAIDSGQALEESVKETRLLEQHTEMGESGRPWVFLLFVGLLAVMVLGIWLKRRAAANGTTLAPNPRAVMAVAIVTALIGIGASYQIYRIGHSGAKASWGDVQIKSGGGEGGESGEG
jgi:glucan phosphoethanolaminetransferase (alkaline phosphatase superfamily)